jgi:hypothetical protein
LRRPEAALCLRVMPAERRGGRLVAALEAAVSLPPRLGCFWGGPLDHSGKRPREASGAGLGGVPLSDGNSGRPHASVRGLRKPWATGVIAPGLPPVHTNSHAIQAGVASRKSGRGVPRFGSAARRVGRNMMSASSCLRTLVLEIVRLSATVLGACHTTYPGRFWPRGAWPGARVVRTRCKGGATCGIAPGVGGRHPIPSEARKPVNGGVDFGHEDDGDSKRPGWFQNRNFLVDRSPKVCK